MTSLTSAADAESDTDVDGAVESGEAEEPEDLVGSVDELTVDSPRPRQPVSSHFVQRPFRTKTTS